jgi:hypothetical protein
MEASNTDDYLAYCRDVYTFYNRLQELIHNWRHSATVVAYTLCLPPVDVPLRGFYDELDHMRIRKEDFPSSDSPDFYVKHAGRQIDSMLKAADIQLAVLSGKTFDPLLLRRELYGIDLEDWFPRASADADAGRDLVLQAIGKERMMELMSASGEGSITGKEKIADHVNGFVARALSKIGDFSYLTSTERQSLREKASYKLDFTLAPGHVMRITPGEKTMYFDADYHFSPTFLDFILSHDYCGHGFHDTLTNEILGKERPDVFRTWYDDECDMFSCFGEGMSCYVERVVPAFLGLSKDVTDYLHVRQRLWLPLRVVLDMKINVQKMPVEEVLVFLNQYGFPADFNKYVIDSIVFHNMGYMSVYYPSLRRMEELQRRHGVSDFDFYQLLITAGNMTIELFEEYLTAKLAKA